MADVFLPVHKRGDDWSLPFEYQEGETEETLAAVSIEPFEITAQIRDSSGNLVDTLEVTKADNQDSTGKGKGLLTPSVRPPDWPIDLLRCDVQFSLDGLPLSTQTFYQPREDDQTKP